MRYYVVLLALASTTAIYASDVNEDGASDLLEHLGYQVEPLTLRGAIEAGGDIMSFDGTAQVSRPRFRNTLLPHVPRSPCCEMHLMFGLVTGDRCAYSRHQARLLMERFRLRQAGKGRTTSVAALYEGMLIAVASPDHHQSCRLEANIASRLKSSATYRVFRLETEVRFRQLRSGWTS